MAPALQNACLAINFNNTLFAMFPVGVFCYNRPNHLQACLQALDRAMDYLGTRLPLYIFCDAPKQDIDLAVHQTWQVAQNHPNAIVILREKNYGFANITEGVSFLCQQFGHAIVVEDDLIVAPDFLSYMTQALDRYKNDEQVFVVSGFMYFDTHPASPQLFFLRQQFIWGWATWQRAWQYYEWRPSHWQKWLSKRKFRRSFDCLHSLSFSNMLRKTLTGKWNTWDIQWMFCQAKAGGLTLFPYRSLVWNCGSGGGTHGDPSKDGDIHLGEKEEYIHGNLTLQDFEKPRLNHPLVFPTKIQADEKALHYLATTFFKQSLRNRPRFKTKVKLRLNQLRTALTGRP